uniref:Spermidine synthase (EC) n=1 Tax=uncultured Thiotrichaceae bacterium TaxID=298394 RepID=A0A6S6UFZ6_9GAMM|nr:MAG: Spermidine synthase (EC [uncultured Thiotrichaceae bacterium]
MKTIETLNDAFGELKVLDHDEFRTLAFAEDDAQSTMLKSTPHILQYEYTQAMLLVLLFCQPKRVLLLGLGGGSLMTTLHHHIKGIHITAVELRALVVEVAYKYFRLPRGKKMQVVQQSADDFVCETMPKKVDVVFADLYHRDGVDETQLQAEFIAHCAKQLKDRGWLVINGWVEHQDNPTFITALQEHFVDIRTVLTGSHNWVILAGKAEDTQEMWELNDKAALLSGQLGFSMSWHLGRLRML